MSGLEFMGVFFVSDDVESSDKVQEELESKAQEIRERAQAEFESYVKSMGLAWEMGVITEAKA